jgi:hypothetical protein
MLEMWKKWNSKKKCGSKSVERGKRSDDAPSIEEKTSSDGGDL